MGLEGTLFCRSVGEFQHHVGILKAPCRHHAGQAATQRITNIKPICKVMFLVVLRRQVPQKDELTQGQDGKYLVVSLSVGCHLQ